MSWEGQEENYNIYRWYKSPWGRYMQTDPLGLNGGVNSYVYAGAQPINGLDPLGLYYYHNDVSIFHDAVNGSYTLIPSTINVSSSCGCDIATRGFRLVFDIRTATEVHIAIRKKKGSFGYYCHLMAEFDHVSIFEYSVRRAAEALIPYEQRLYASENECRAAAQRGYDAMAERVRSLGAALFQFSAQLLEEIRHNTYNPCPFPGTP